MFQLLLEVHLFQVQCGTAFCNRQPKTLREWSKTYLLLIVNAVHGDKKFYLPRLRIVFPVQTGSCQDLLSASLPDLTAPHEKQCAARVQFSKDSLYLL